MTVSRAPLKPPLALVLINSLFGCRTEHSKIILVAKTFLSIPLDLLKFFYMY